MVLRSPSLVEQVKQDLEKAFTCKCKGKLMEHMGEKITID
jgi:hypothetical protein